MKKRGCSTLLDAMPSNTEVATTLRGNEPQENSRRRTCRKAPTSCMAATPRPGGGVIGQPERPEMSGAGVVQRRRQEALVPVLLRRIMRCEHVAEHERNGGPDDRDRPATPVSGCSNMTPQSIH